VVHPFVCEQVIRQRIPIRIKNIKNPTGQGTIIFPDKVNGVGETPSPHYLRQEDYYLRQEDYFNNLQPHFAALDRRPTAVTIKDRIMVINIHSNQKSVSYGFLASIFVLLDKHKLVVDLISTSEVHISMALNERMGHHVLSNLVTDLKRHGTVDVVKEMAILSLVGKQMKHLVGIAGEMFSALASVGVNIEMISQGASEIKSIITSRKCRLIGSISCVIVETDSTKALNATHYHLLSAL
jgi:aspartate kinase